VGDWSQGVRVENARSLVDYWERGYDWRRFESDLNRFPQFLTEIDGLDIHFIHVRSKKSQRDAADTHARMAGSIVEFLKLIGPLTDSGSVRRRPLPIHFDVVRPVAPRVRVLQKPRRPGGLYRAIQARGWSCMSVSLHEMGRARRAIGVPSSPPPSGPCNLRGFSNSSETLQYAFPAQIPDTLSPNSATP